MKSLISIVIVCVFVLNNYTLYAIPKYDDGALLVNGVQLLQDHEDELAYYYLPQYPHLAKNADGDFELLCIKYVGGSDEENGGLFHALVEFTLPSDILDEVEKELMKIRPNSKIVGPVRLLDLQKKVNDQRLPSFEIVSAILNDQSGDNPFTRKVVSSGHAPFTPGSKAAVAAVLNQEGATLLWDTFQGAASDVSLTVNGYYEAHVEGYNAIVSASIDVIYSHFSEIENKQGAYKKNQVREVVDSLQQIGDIDVDVFDRSESLGIEVGDMEKILNLVTNKLVELMFDSETGWAQTPDKIDHTLGFDERGRRGDKSESGEIISGIGDALYNLTPAGWFSPRKNDNNPEYVTDDQYILKDISDIRTSKFYLNLSQSTTIKVPLHSTGNLGGLYQEFGEDERYFRVIDLNDADFQRREVNFHIDGAYVGGFEDLVNFVSVNFRKKYPESSRHDNVLNNISLSKKDIDQGILFKGISYPRLGFSEEDFGAYEYQVIWSLQGSDEVIRFPESQDEWIKSHDSDVVLSLPFEQTEIIIDADRKEFGENKVKTATVTIATKRAGEAQVVRNIVLRDKDTDNTNKVYIYRDPNEPIVYQTSWYGSKGEQKIPLAEMKGTYLFLMPPKE